MHYNTYYVSFAVRYLLRSIPLIFKEREKDKRENENDIQTGKTPSKTSRLLEADGKTKLVPKRPTVHDNILHLRCALVLQERGGSCCCCCLFISH